MDGSLDFLIFLAEQGAASDGFVRLPTTVIARTFPGASQQTASRWLAQYAKLGYIERRGPSELRILPAGRKKLERAYAALHRTLKGTRRKRFAVEGAVVSGFREGSYYIALPQYQKQFREKLGFQPYPGTLNVKLSAPKDIQQSRLIRALPGIGISGFDKDGREFGAARCYPCVIAGKVRGAIVVPLRTHYGEDIVEVIAPAYLRGKLGLSDASRVRIETAGQTA